MTESVADAFIYGLIGLLSAVLLLELFVRWKRDRKAEPVILFLLVITAALGILAGASHYLTPTDEGGNAQVAESPQSPHLRAGCLFVLGLSAAFACYFKRRHRDIHLAEEGRPTYFKTFVMKHRKHAVEGNMQFGYNAMLFLTIASLATGVFVKAISPASESNEAPNIASSEASNDQSAQPRTVAELIAEADKEADPVPEPESVDAETMVEPPPPIPEIAASEEEKDSEPMPDVASEDPPAAAPKGSPNPAMTAPGNGEPMATRSPSIGAPQDFNPATKRPRNIPKNVFASHIRPILQKHCFSCHGPTKQKSDLRLDTAEGIRKGGKNGPVAIAGSPEKSPLYTATVLPPDDPDIMPAKGDPLTKKETELLRKWILYGADLGDGKHFADASSGGTGFAVDQLANGIPLPDAALLESLKADGVIVRAVSANQSLLDLDFTHIENKNLLKLDRLAPIARNVHSLDLTRSMVSDADLATIAPMQNLVRLQLNKTSISDDGIEHLQGLANLEILNLYGTGVTDAGLAHLTGMQKLQKLYLWEAQATPEGAEKLKSKIPGLKVIF